MPIRPPGLPPDAVFRPGLPSGVTPREDRLPEDGAPLLPRQTAGGDEILRRNIPRFIDQGGVRDALQRGLRVIIHAIKRRGGGRRVFEPANVDPPYQSKTGKPSPWLANHRAYGLVKPFFDKRAGGFRMYAPANVHRIDVIDPADGSAHQVRRFLGQKVDKPTEYAKDAVVTDPATGQEQVRPDRFYRRNQGPTDPASNASATTTAGTATGNLRAARGGRAFMDENALHFAIPSINLRTATSGVMDSLRDGAGAALRAVDPRETHRQLRSAGRGRVSSALLSGLASVMDATVVPGPLTTAFVRRAFGKPKPQPAAAPQQDRQQFARKLPVEPDQLQQRVAGNAVPAGTGQIDRAGMRIRRVLDEASLAGVADQNIDRLPVAGDALAKPALKNVQTPVGGRGRIANLLRRALSLRHGIRAGATPADVRNRNAEIDRLNTRRDLGLEGGTGPAAPQESPRGRVGGRDITPAAARQPKPDIPTVQPRGGSSVSDVLRSMISELGGGQSQGGPSVSGGIPRERRQAITGRRLFAEDSADDDEDLRSLFVIARLPKYVAENYPHKPQDSSPPHITLLYTGKQTRQQAVKLGKECANWLKDVAPLHISGQGRESFPKGKDGVPVYTPVVDDDCWHEGRVTLRELHEKCEKAARAAGVEWTPTHNQYVPHVTIRYVDSEDDVLAVDPPERWWTTIDRVEVRHGDEVIAILPLEHQRDKISQPPMANSSKYSADVRAALHFSVNDVEERRPGGYRVGGARGKGGRNKRSRLGVSQLLAQAVLNAFRNRGPRQSEGELPGEVEDDPVMKISGILGQSEPGDRDLIRDDTARAALRRSVPMRTPRLDAVRGRLTPDQAAAIASRRLLRSMRGRPQPQASPRAVARPNEHTVIGAPGLVKTPPAVSGPTAITGPVDEPQPQRGAARHQARDLGLSGADTELARRRQRQRDVSAGGKRQRGPIELTKDQAALWIQHANALRKPGQNSFEPALTTASNREGARAMLRGMPRRFRDRESSTSFNELRQNGERLTDLCLTDGVTVLDAIRFGASSVQVFNAPDRIDYRPVGGVAPASQHQQQPVSLQFLDPGANGVGGGHRVVSVEAHRVHDDGGPAGVNFGDSRIRQLLLAAIAQGREPIDTEAGNAPGPDSQRFGIRSATSGIRRELGPRGRGGIGGMLLGGAAGAAVGGPVGMLAGGAVGGGAGAVLKASGVRTALRAGANAIGNAAGAVAPRLTNRIASAWRIGRGMWNRAQQAGSPDGPPADGEQQFESNHEALQVEDLVTQLLNRRRQQFMVPAGGGSRTALAVNHMLKGLRTRRGESAA